MRAYLDLGTSRTAFAMTDDHGAWVPLPETGVIRSGGTKSADVWRALDRLIRGTANAGTPIDQPIDHWIFHSRFAEVGELVMPVVIGDELELPVGVELLPDVRKMDTQFESVKDNGRFREKFAGSITRFARALVGEENTWVVGSSSGASVSPLVGLQGGRAFNEAIAVVFALMAHNRGELLKKHEGRFVVLADLGGGFLDICVADNLQYQENERDAEIVSFGGYPIGVDRIVSRFSVKEFDAPILGELLTLAIQYHIWDYRNRSEANKTKDGVLFLTGGGFRRLRGYVFPSSVKAVTSQSVTYDTKYLTLLGLKEMARLNTKEERGLGENISRRNPHFHASEVVDDLSKRAEWIRPALKEASTAESWYVLLDNLRRLTLGKQVHRE